MSKGFLSHWWRLVPRSCGKLEAPPRCKRPAERMLPGFTGIVWNMISWKYAYIYISSNMNKTIFWMSENRDFKNNEDVHHQPLYCDMLGKQVGYGDWTEFSLGRNCHLLLQADSTGKTFDKSWSTVNLSKCTYLNIYIYIFIVECIQYMYITQNSCIYIYTIYII